MGQVQEHGHVEEQRPHRAAAETARTAAGQVAAPVHPVLALQRRAGNAAVAALLDRAAPPAQVPVQRLLQPNVDEWTFLKHLSVGKRDPIAGALRDLLVAAQALKPRVEYDVFRSLALDAARQGVKAVRRLTANLAATVADILDPELSGVGGHMYGKHILVSQEAQERRLTSGEVTRSTRPVMEGHAGDRVAAFIRALHRSDAVETVREDVEVLVHNLLEDLQDPGSAVALAWAAGNSVNAKKAAVRAWLRENAPESGDGRLYTLTYAFDLAPATAGAGLQIKIKPELRSTSEFDKDLATVDERGGIEHRRVSEPLKMFWGRNNPVIDGIEPGADRAALVRQASGWNPEGVLGITMF